MAHSEAEVTMTLEEHHAVRQALQRALSADQHALLLVANNNGTASQEAWDRIVADPTYKRLEANLAQSEAAIKIVDEIGKGIK